MTKRKVVKWVALVVAILILVCVVAGILVLRSRAFHQFVLAEIVSSAQQATGGKVQVGDFTLNLSDLRADLYRIVIHGTEPNPAAPLLRVDHLQVELKIISLLGRKIGLRNVEIDHPVIHLRVNAKGQTNLPQPPPSPQPSKPVDLFNLAIDRFRLVRGEIDAEDHQLPLEASLRNLRIQSDFNAQKKEYDGAIQYRAGEIQFGNYRPLPHSFSLAFSATPEELRVNPLEIRAAGSSIAVRAALQSYTHPIVNGSYSVQLATAEAARIIRSTAAPSGEVSTRGTFVYTSAPGRALLDSLALSGIITSPRLAVRLPDAHGQVAAMSGQYRLLNGDFTLKDLKANAFGGRLAVNAAVRQLSGQPTGSVTASIQSLSLGALRGALPHNQWAKFPVNGNLSASTEALWRGSLARLRAHTDATLQAALGAVEAPKPGQEARAIPLHATVHAGYDARTSALTFERTVLATPESEIDVNGTLGSRAALAITTRVRDLREIDELLTRVRTFTSTASSPAQPLGLSGSASFQGTVRGSLQSPRLGARLAGEHLTIQHASFSHIQTQIEASPSRFALTDGELQAAQGNARFRASLCLHDWALSPSRPVAFELTANRLSIGTLASVAHVKYPVQGILSAQISVHGTVQHPQLGGDLSADNLRLMQAAFPHVQTHLAVSDSSVVLSQGEIVAAQGNARFRASAGLHHWTFNPLQPVAFDLIANRMSIGALTSVARLKYPIQGILSAQVSAHGTAARPEGSGTIQILKAQAWNQPIQAIRLAFQANGTAVQSNLQVRTPGGKVNADLTYSLPTQRYKGQITVAGLHLGKLRALKAYHVQGIATASVRGQGTLNSPRLQAQISIPTLQIGHEAITGVSAQADVSNRVLTLGFNSSFSGIPAHAHGTVNLTGNYEAALDFSTGTIEAGPLVSALRAGAATGIQCETQLKAWLRGPLKDQQRLQAHLEIPTFRLGYQSVQVASVSAITADYQNGSVVFKSAEIKGTGTDFRFQASAPVIGSGPISASATGTIDFHIVQLFEPDWVSSGQLQISAVAQGTRRSPQVQGRIRIVNAAFVPPDAPIGIQNMNGTIAFNSTRAEITRLTAQAGGGSVKVSGSATYAHGVQFDLALNADRLNLAYPEGVSEVLAAQLRLFGTPDGAQLSGQVLINDLSLSPQFDLATFTDQFNTVSVPAGPPSFTSNVKLNLAVRSSHEITLTSDQLSLGGTADLRAIGTIDDPVVVGRVTLANGGTLMFGGNRYVIQTGTINFVNPVIIDPVLDVSLATTIDQYDVTLTFTGPVDRMRTTYTSSPSLAQADIISLLVSGHPTEAPSQSLGTESVLAAGLSQASSRALKMAGISSLTIDPQVGGYQSNPGVNIGMQKQATKNLFFTFSVNTATTQDAVVQVQYQVTPHWSVEALRDEVGGYSLEIRLHRKF
jgi:autotransporter translocation and assembly factor TamB